jgi:predicted hotdog family 3-hydroxylacyl-ACP dehydratase
MREERTAIARGDDLLRYIPQRPPVVMVDEFCGVEGDESYSGFTVPEDNIFCRDGVLDECALVENMAQSAALRVGWLCVNRGRDVPLGFIGSVGKCEIAGRVRAGQRLRTTVRVVAEVGNVTLAEAWIDSGGARICSCTLKIFLQQ